MNNIQIDEIIDRIVENVYPDSIFLFGSHANGLAGEDSDVDLVVVWNTDLDTRSRNLYLKRLFPHRKFSLDIFAYTPEEIIKYRDVKGTIINSAIEDGIMVYGGK